MAVLIAEDYDVCNHAEESYLHLRISAMENSRQRELLICGYTKTFLSVLLLLLFFLPLLVVIRSLLFFFVCMRRSRARWLHIQIPWLRSNFKVPLWGLFKFIVWASAVCDVCVAVLRCSDDRDNNNSCWRTKKKHRGKQSTLKAHWSWKEIAHLCRHIFSHNDPNYDTNSRASFKIRISYWRNYSSMN